MRTSPCPSRSARCSRSSPPPRPRSPPRTSPAASRASAPPPSARCSMPWPASAWRAGSTTAATPPDHMGLCWRPLVCRRPGDRRRRYGPHDLGFRHAGPQRVNLADASLPGASRHRRFRRIPPADHPATRPARSRKQSCIAPAPRPCRSRPAPSPGEFRRPPTRPLDRERIQVRAGLRERGPGIPGAGRTIDFLFLQGPAPASSIAIFAK